MNSQGVIGQTFNLLYYVTNYLQFNNLLLKAHRWDRWYWPCLEKISLRLFQPGDCLATETSLNIEIVHAASLLTVFSTKWTPRRRADCADAQAGLSLCWSHSPESAFIATKPYRLCHKNMCDICKRHRQKLGSVSAPSKKQRFFVRCVR